MSRVFALAPCLPIFVSVLDLLDHFSNNNKITRYLELNGYNSIYEVTCYKIQFEVAGLVTFLSLSSILPYI